MILTPASKLIMLPSLVLFLFSFRKLGDEWSVDQDVTDELKAFTYLMYGYTREKSVDSVRSIMLKKMLGENEELTIRSKVDLARLPPCKDNFIPHVWRVNYRLANYKKKLNRRYFGAPIPPIQAQGWEKTEGGILEPGWCCGAILPPSLIDLLEKTTEETENVAEEEEEQETLKSF